MLHCQVAPTPSGREARFCSLPVQAPQLSSLAFHLLLPALVFPSQRQEAEEEAQEVMRAATTTTRTVPCSQAVAAQLVPSLRCNHLACAVVLRGCSK